MSERADAATDGPTGTDADGAAAGRPEQPGRAEGAVHPALAVLLWLWVLVPFGYGVYQLVVKIPALFGA